MWYCDDGFDGFSAVICVDVDCEYLGIWLLYSLSIYLLPDHQFLSRFKILDTQKGFDDFIWIWDELFWKDLS